MALFDEEGADKDKLIVMGTPAHMEANIPGAEIRRGRCGHDMWISPSMLEMVDSPRGACVCLPCALQDESCRKSLQENGLLYTDKQRAELNKQMGVAKTDQAIASLKAKRFDVERFRTGKAPD